MISISMCNLANKLRRDGSVALKLSKTVKKKTEFDDTFNSTPTKMTLKLKKKKKEKLKEIYEEFMILLYSPNLTEMNQNRSSFSKWPRIFHSFGPRRVV